MTYRVHVKFSGKRVYVGKFKAADAYDALEQAQKAHPIPEVTNPVWSAEAEPVQYENGE